MLCAAVAAAAAAHSDNGDNNFELKFVMLIDLAA